MHISESIHWELILDPIFAQELILVESLLQSSSRVTIVCGRTDITEEEYDGVDTLYYPSTVPFIARKTNSGVIIDYV